MKDIDGRIAMYGSMVRDTAAIFVGTSDTFEDQDGRRNKIISLERIN